jgi:hypothetical protein
MGAVEKNSAHYPLEAIKALVLERFQFKEK